MSTAGAVFADKTGFSAGAYIISLSLSLSDAWIWSSLTDQSSTLSQYALELNWSVGTTWRCARDDPYSEISFDAALWCAESALEAFQSSLKDDKQKQMFYQLKLLMKIFYFYTYEILFIPTNA